MKTSIGIRLDEEFIEKLDSLGEKEKVDRSTMIRKILERGYKEYLKERSSDKYRKGEVTISKAAELAETTVWEMEKYLVERGYVSEYSIKDLKSELEMLE